MDIFSLFSPKACDIRGKKSTDKWSWTEYFENKARLEAENTKVILIDMINHPVEGSIPISNDIFYGNHYPA